MGKNIDGSGHWSCTIGCAVVYFVKLHLDLYCYQGRRKVLRAGGAANGKMGTLYKI